MHKRSCPILPAVKTALILAYIPAVFSFLSWSHHVSPYFYDFFFLKTESASRPLLHHLPFFGPSEETTLTFYKPVEIPMHTVTSVPFPIPRNMNCLLFLKVFCPYNQTAIIILHECLYTSAPYEPLHRRDCVLFILASWYIKHVNYSSLYIY